MDAVGADRSGRRLHLGRWVSEQLVDHGKVWLLRTAELLLEHGRLLPARRETVIHRVRSQWKSRVRRHTAHALFDVIGPTPALPSPYSRRTTIHALFCTLLLSPASRWVVQDLPGVTIVGLLLRLSASTRSSLCARLVHPPNVHAEADRRAAAVEPSCSEMVRAGASCRSSFADALGVENLGAQLLGRRIADRLPRRGTKQAGAADDVLAAIPASGPRAEQRPEVRSGSTPPALVSSRLSRVGSTVPERQDRAVVETRAGGVRRGSMTRRGERRAATHWCRPCRCRGRTGARNHQLARRARASMPSMSAERLAIDDVGERERRADAVENERQRLPRATMPNGSGAL